VDKVLPDDFVNVRGLDEAVPHLLRIDHNDGAVLALVQAAGLVRADRTLQPGFGGRLFEERVEFSLAVRGAAAARGRRVTLVGADKNVAIEFRHGPPEEICLPMMSGDAPMILFFHLRFAAPPGWYLRQWVSLCNLTRCTP